MSIKKIIRAFEYYQKAQASTRQLYLNKFEEKMIYRTTKTENPETTPKMVKDVLHKFSKA